MTLTKEKLPVPLLFLLLLVAVVSKTIICHNSDNKGGGSIFVHCFSLVEVKIPKNHNNNNKKIINKKRSNSHLYYNVIQKYEYYEDDKKDHLLSECYEIDYTPPSPEEEDEVAMWYPTTYRSFLFKRLIDNDTNSNDESDSSSSSDDDDDIVITMRETSFGCSKLGHTIWDSSIVLCLDLISKSSSMETSSSTILELGAGCGLPSVVCNNVLDSKKIISTDFWQPNDNDNEDNEQQQQQSTNDKDRLIPTYLHGMNLKYNLDYNSKLLQQKRQKKDNSISSVEEENSNSIIVQRLDFHKESTVLAVKKEFYDTDINQSSPPRTTTTTTTDNNNVIIGSDLMYYCSDIQPFLDTLKVLLFQTPPPLPTDDDANGEISEKDIVPITTSAAKSVLIFPLPPYAKREALPEFEKQIYIQFEKTHNIMKDITILKFVQDDKESKFLRIQMSPLSK